MKHEETSLEALAIIGIQTRTSNSDEMSGSGKISALWSQFYAEQFLNKIPNRLDNEVIAVYHNYESDANGPYTLTIGAKVATGSKVPLGMVLLNISAQKYSRFTTNKGEMPGIVIEAWKNIWELTEKSELKRKYSYDFEVYGKGASDPKFAEIDIYIALQYTSRVS